MRSTSAKDLPRIEPGSLVAEHFDLLLAGTRADSQRVVDSLRAHLVDGKDAKLAQAEHGVSASEFSRLYKSLRVQHVRAMSLAPFYTVSQPV